LAPALVGTIVILANRRCAPTLSLLGSIVIDMRPWRALWAVIDFSLRLSI